ncbi:hypothetical protein Sfulv_29560 [Streptomyces fulvorobeus]|nr:hypothetical protein Sfulv_29560 [Streptomyces fulvorobeus]
MTAVAALGPVGWTYAAERPPGGAAHRPAVPLLAGTGARGPLAPAPRSGELAGTSTSGPSAPATTAPPSRPTAPPPWLHVPAPGPSGRPSATTSGSASATPSAPTSAPAPAASGRAKPSSGVTVPPAGSSASPSASADVSPLAGRPAGAGRARPGRSLSPIEIARADSLLEEEEKPAPDLGEALPEDVTPGASPRPAPQAMDGPAVRQVQEVSLGAGIALVGLGLGFLALRMRRAL